jgi:hypothetical protein
MSGPCRSGFKTGYSAVGAHVPAPGLALQCFSPLIIRESPRADRHPKPVRIGQYRIGHDGGQSSGGGNRFERRRLGRFIERPCNAKRVRLFKIKGIGADSAMITLLGLITLLGRRRRSGMITFIRTMITLMITFI